MLFLLLLAAVVRSGTVCFTSTVDVPGGSPMEIKSESTLTGTGCPDAATMTSMMKAAGAEGKGSVADGACPAMTTKCYMKADSLKDQNTMLPSTCCSVMSIGLMTGATSCDQMQMLSTAPEPVCGTGGTGGGTADPCLPKQMEFLNALSADCKLTVMSDTAEKADKCTCFKSVTLDTSGWDAACVKKLGDESAKACATTGTTVDCNSAEAAACEKCTVCLTEPGNAVCATCGPCLKFKDCASGSGGSSGDAPCANPVDVEKDAVAPSAGKYLQTTAGATWVDVAKGAVAPGAGKFCAAMAAPCANPVDVMKDAVAPSAGKFLATGGSAWVDVAKGDAAPSAGKFCATAFAGPCANPVDVAKDDVAPTAGKYKQDTAGATWIDVAKGAAAPGAGKFCATAVDPCMAKQAEFLGMLSADCKVKLSDDNAAKADKCACFKSVTVDTSGWDAKCKKVLADEAKKAGDDCAPKEKETNKATDKAAGTTAAPSGFLEVAVSMIFVASALLF